MLVNTLIHREMTSSFIAKFVIQKDRMYVENASRALKDGMITPDNLEPNPKNPIIAAFFRNIGYSDQLGSGVRNLFKYTNFYSGKNPELIEGDIFRIIVPLDDEYSFDYEISSEAAGEFTGRDTLKTTQKTTQKTTPKTTQKTTQKTTHKQSKKLTPTERKILEAVRINPNITQIQLAEQIGITRDGIRYAIRNLKSKGILERTGSRKNGSWIRRCPGEK